MHKHVSPFPKTNLCLSSPHFEAGLKLPFEDWDHVLRGHEELQDCVKFKVLASLVYHEDFLFATLPKEHPLFSSPVLALTVSSSFLVCVCVCVSH